MTNGVTATTQSAGDNSTKVATTAYTDTAISNLVDSSPNTLNTLNELAAALGDDANFSTTVTNSIATKLPLAGGTLTGNLTISHDHPRIIFNDTSNNPDYLIDVNAGHFLIYDSTNSANRFLINSDGHIDLLGNVDITNGLDVTGGITASSTGNASLILDAGTGSQAGNQVSFIDFKLDGTVKANIAVNEATSGNPLEINSAGTGATKLFNAGSEKLSTSSSGVSVSGTCTATTFSGSGASLTNVNAATLDSLDSTQFVRSDATDIVSGATKFTNIGLELSGHWFNRYYDAANRQNYIHFYPATSSDRGTSASRTDIRAWTGTTFDVLRIIGGSNDITWRANKIWNAGNDGSGSGLDADTLDGVQGSSYLRSDADDTFTGDLTLNGRLIANEGSPPATGYNHFISDDGSATTIGTAATLRVANNGGNAAYSVFEAESGSGSIRLANDGQFYVTGSTTFSNRVRTDLSSTADGFMGEAYSSYFGLKHTDQTLGSEYMIISRDADTFISASSTHKVRIRSGGNDSTNELQVGNGVNALTWRGNKVFHAGNDGSGSGLDADTLDGAQGSQFLRSDSADTCSGQITFTNSIISSKDGNKSTQGGAALVLTHGTTSALRMNFFIHDDFPSGGGTGYLQVTEAGVSNDRHLNLQGYGGKVMIGNANGTPTEMLDVNGNVKAANFSGSGSLLTNIPAGQLTGTLPALDGSNLTGLTVNNAQTLDNLDSTQFLRSDANDTISGTITFTSGGLNLSTNDIYLDARVIQNASGGTDDGMYIGYNNASSGVTRIYGGGSTSGHLGVHGTGSNDLKFLANTVWHAGNDGAGSGLDADTLDGVSSGGFLRSDINDAQAPQRIEFKANATNNYDTIATTSGSLGCIEIFNEGSGNDAFMAFHTGSDFAFYFGLDADTNKLAVGGWSMGANKYAIYHEGNNPTFSQLGITAANINALGINATTLDSIDSGSFIRSDTDDAIAYQHQIRYYSNSNIQSTSSYEASLEVYQGTAQSDAFMAFHVAGDFATYFGLDGGTNNLAVGGWSMGNASYKVWNQSNDGSGSGLDADTVDGLNPATTGNNARIVRTNSAGYVFANYFNTTADDTGTGSDCKFYASQDDYIRYIDLRSMRSVMNVSANSRAFSGREDQTSNQDYWIGSVGWGTTSFNDLWNYGSCFFDTWGNPSGQPSGTSHWNGVQSMHYNNGSVGGSYGFRIVVGAGSTSLSYIAGNWGGTTYSFVKLWNGSNDGSGSGLDSDLLDGQHGSHYLNAGNLTGNLPNRIGLGTSVGGTPGSRAAFLALGDNDTGVGQNGDGQLELWANNQEIMNIDTSGTILYKRSRINQSSHNDLILWLNATNTNYVGDGFKFHGSRSATSANNFCAFDSGHASSADREFTLRGDGNAYADGTWNNNGADYAEFFESSTGSAIPVGTTVVLENNKVRAATSSDAVENIIGVVRPKAAGQASMTIGNTAWNKWHGKYLTDDFDCFILDDHNVIEWTDADGELHSYESHAIPSDVTIPSDAKISTHDSKGNKYTHYRMNPDFDSSKAYVPRHDRDEWVIIGLVGQVKTLKGQIVNNRWIKMRDVSDTVEEYFIR